jgi:hypothetical protein
MSGLFTERLEEALQPWMTPSLSIVCEAIGAMGYDALLELIEEEGSEGEPDWVAAWGKVFDPDLCPAAALPYLGCFVGVEIPKGTPEAEARALVKAKAGTERGTRASVVAAIEGAIAPFWTADTAYLKGQLVRHTEGVATTCYEVTANFTSGSSFATTHLTVVNIATQYELLERERADGESNAYYFTVLCHGYQLTPEDNLAQMEARVNAAKPAGLVPEYVVTEEPLATDPYIDEGTLLIESVAEAALIESCTLAQIT